MAKRGWMEKVGWFGGSCAKTHQGLDTVGLFNKVPCGRDAISKPVLKTAHGVFQLHESVQTEALFLIKFF